MKISKITWVFLLLGILIIVGVILGFNYRNLVSEQAGLKDQILATDKKVAAIQVKDLQQKEIALMAQQKKIETQTSVIKNSFIQPVNYINITDTLYTLASDNNVELQRIASADATAETLSKVPFSSIPVTVQMKGTVSDILQFIKSLTARYNLSFVKPVQIDVPAKTPGITIPRIWSLESGSLPEGLKLDPVTGTISGIPDNAEGTSSFTVKAAFSDNTSDTQDLSITINSHEITSTSAADGEINVPYSQKLAASGIVPDSSPVGAENTLPTATITMNILSGEVN